MKKIAILALCGMLPIPALAQDGGWDFSASIYAWVPGLGATVDTPFGELESKSTGGNVLDNLDMAFMGAFEARKDQWSVLLDLLYTKLSTSKDAPFGEVFSQANVQAEVTAFSGYGLYRSYESDHLIADIGLGLRAFKIDLGTEFESGDLGGDDHSFGGDRSWVLPLVAGRFIVPFNENWFGTTFFDYGQTRSDVSTWQGLVTVGYHFNERWSMQAGYRYMDVQQKIGGLDADLEFSGPVIGVTAHF
ncbi:hypothetical protein [Paracoccus sp. KR1-242]|uniref:hypothetical protein n=1 Tax=Paracoccus sp. KR1-242 TaxID=3410028 RepID=UPI003C032512